MNNRRADLRDKPIASGGDSGTGPSMEEVDEALKPLRPRTSETSALPWWATSSRDGFTATAARRSKP